MNTELEIATFRALSTREDWESAVKIRNTYHLQRPLTVDQLIEGTSFHPPSVKCRRTLMNVGGRDVGYASTIENYWMKSEDRFEIQCVAKETEHFVTLFDNECEAAIRDGARKVSTWQRSDQPAHLEYVLSNGFAETQRNPESALDLDAFDPSAYGKLLHDVRRRYDIVDYATFAKIEPDDWHRVLWRIEMDVLSDVPLPEPHEETPFEDWRRELVSSAVDHRAMFVALLDGTPAGISQLLPNSIDPKVCSTGLTGVRRDHRRQGLATALKVTALVWAKGRGIRMVWTDNEEANPMFGLNQKLGFEKQFEWVCLERAKD